MKLKSMRVMNFKCIEDTGEFSVLPVTCLVGKNEAGKTSTMEALHKLNPDVDEMGQFDVLLEYPRRRRKQYQMRAESEPDDALITKWELEDQDVAALEDEFGPDTVKSRMVEIRMGYYPGRKWKFIGSGPDGEVIAAPLRAKLEKMLPRFLYFAKYNILEGRVSIDAILDHIQRGCISGSERIFLALLNMVDTRPEHLARIENSEELIADLEAASAPITQQISRYWSQNRSLQVSFQLHPGKPQDRPPFDKGLVFETRILNTRHNLTLNFDERSTGFVWFFSFLIWFAEIKRAFGENLFILLDDPGIGLHARAQTDLLRYMKAELEPFYQVLYTTHSPFMVDAKDPQRVRTVEDVIIEENRGIDKFAGTKVGEKVLSTDSDTLTPLRAALGYEIAKSMGGNGKKTLLVDSITEAMYLRWFSRRLNQRGRRGLDAEWSVVPCGSGARIGAFLGLFGGDTRNVAVLLDAQSGQEELKSLHDNELLKGCKILTVDDFTGVQYSSIEDLIGTDYYNLVNLCYKLPRRNRIKYNRSAAGQAELMAESPQQSSPTRVLQTVRDHFGSMSPGGIYFDRCDVAEYLTENTKKCSRKLPGINQALDRFEQLFSALA